MKIFKKKKKQQDLDIKMYLVCLEKIALQGRKKQWKRMGEFWIFLFICPLSLWLICVLLMFFVVNIGHMTGKYWQIRMIYVFLNCSIYCLRNNFHWFEVWLKMFVIDLNYILGCISAGKRAKVDVLSYLNLIIDFFSVNLIL